MLSICCCCCCNYSSAARRSTDVWPRLGTSARRKKNLGAHRCTSSRQNTQKKKETKDFELSRSKKKSAERPLERREIEVVRVYNIDTHTHKMERIFIFIFPARWCTEYIRHWKDVETHTSAGCSVWYVGRCWRRHTLYYRPHARSTVTISRG